MQVLIVDDDPDLQDAICETLEGGGHAATCVERPPGARIPADGEADLPDPPRSDDAGHERLGVSETTAPRRRDRVDPRRRPQRARQRGEGGPLARRVPTKAHRRRGAVEHRGEVLREGELAVSYQLSAVRASAQLKTDG